MLYRTSTDKRHYHVVYVDDGVAPSPVVQGSEPQPQPVATTSLDKKHTHDVLIDADGLLTTTPGPDGHVHILEPYEYKEPKAEKETEEDQVKRVHELVAEAKKYEEESRKRGKESWGFYDGTKQWSDEAKNKLKNQKRACLRVNAIAPKVDLLHGYQMQNRSDILVLPQENGDERVAEILTMLIKGVWDRNHGAMHESNKFLDSTVVGRGLDRVSMDWDASVEGEIRLEHQKWDSMYLGPHDRSDLEDLEYVVIVRKYSRSKVKEIWPEKADELQNWLEEVDRIRGTQFNDYRVNSMVDGVELTDIARKEVFVYECIRKTYQSVYVADVGSERIDLEGVSQKDVKKLETIDGITTRRRIIYKVATEITGGDVLLEDFENDVNEIPVSVAYAKRDGDGGFYGKVEEVKDLQRQINKGESSLSDWIVRGAGGSKYYVTGNTFTSEAEKSRFLKNASSPFGVFTVTSDAPVREDTPPLPAALLTYRNVQSEALQRAMNIPMEAFGVNLNSEVSGRAIQESRRSGMAANEFLFENLNIAKERIGRLIIKYIAEYYTTDRIIREIANSKPDQISQELQQMDLAEIARIFNDKEALLKYDVKVTTSPESETYKTMMFFEMTDLIRSGALPGSPAVQSLLIRNSMLSEEDKARMLGDLQAESEAAAQSQQQTDARESFKSLPDEAQLAMVAAGQAPGLQAPAPSNGSQV